MCDSVEMKKFGVVLYGGEGDGEDLRKSRVLRRDTWRFGRDNAGRSGGLNAARECV